MKKGFTLIELLAIIVLLGLVFAISFPKVLEIVEKKEIEIDDVTRKLIYNGVDQYMKNNVDTYPQKIGNSYCFLIDNIDKENLIAVSVDDYLDKYVTVKIGKTNIYKIVNDCGEICKPTDANCYIYTNKDLNIEAITISEALNELREIYK